MKGLVHTITPKAHWDDLQLPGDTEAALRELVRFAGKGRQHLKDRAPDPWKAARGAVALFSGPSGTGKTLSAEVIARELGLPLYRVDLSAVVSKYVGETEKNLSRVFDLAAESGAILLFDEADALFGKRAAVKDSHDRYANLEVNYLLQRLEAFTGLAILAANLQQNIDAAFLRRIRFVIDFPLPGT